MCVCSICVYVPLPCAFLHVTWLDYGQFLDCIMRNPIGLYHAVHLAFQLKDMEKQATGMLKPKGFNIVLPSDINVRDFGHALLIATNGCHESTFKTTKSYGALADEMFKVFRQHLEINDQVGESIPAYGCS